MSNSVTVNSGSVEALKWLALLLMVGDHVNKYLFNGTLPLLFEVGRMAMPLFGMVLAYNLATYGTNVDFFKRLMIRLFIIGVVSTPFYIALGGVLYNWWPLNIFFTLLVATAVIYAIGLGTPMYRLFAVVIFLCGGALVEFLWPAVLIVIAAYYFCKRPSLITSSFVVISCALLTYTNGNCYALLAIPVAYVATTHNIQFSRFKWVFYTFYPAHLAVLMLIRIPMAKAGYLFLT